MSPDSRNRFAAWASALVFLLGGAHWGFLRAVPWALALVAFGFTMVISTEFRRWPRRRSFSNFIKEKPSREAIEAWLATVGVDGPDLFTGATYDPIVFITGYLPTVVGFFLLGSSTDVPDQWILVAGFAARAAVVLVMGNLFCLLIGVSPDLSRWIRRSRYEPCQAIAASWKAAQQHQAVEAAARMKANRDAEKEAKAKFDVQFTVVHLPVLGGKFKMPSVCAGCGEPLGQSYRMKKLSSQDAYFSSAYTKYSSQVPICQDCDRNEANASGFKRPNIWLDRSTVQGVHRGFAKAYKELNDWRLNTS